MQNTYYVYSYSSSIYGYGCGGSQNTSSISGGKFREKKCRPAAIRHKKLNQTEFAGPLPAVCRDRCSIFPEREEAHLDELLLYLTPIKTLLGTSIEASPHLSFSNFFLLLSPLPHLASPRPHLGRDP